MGNPQDHTKETIFSECIFNRGNDYSKINNFKLAIASYSWAIAFNNDFLDSSTKSTFSFKAPINYKVKYLNKRGQEYLKNYLYLQAIEDFKRSINIHHLGNADAFSGWQDAYYGYKIHPGLYPYYSEQLKENFRKTYQYSKNWPQKTKSKPDFRHVFEDIWVAVNAGGTQRSIDYSNAGLRSAIYGNWEEALNNFLLAIDTDLLFAETFTSEEYHLANYNIKSALRDDINKIKFSNKQYTLSLGNCIYSFPDEYENCVKPQRLNNVIDDNFFLSLQDFCESNGREIFIERCFYGLFSDYINGEHKKDMLLLKKIINTGLMEIINKMAIVGYDRNIDLNRMVDIIYYLLILQIKRSKE